MTPDPTRPYDPGTLFAALRSTSSGVYVRPWMVAALGPVAAIWFAQLLWRLHRADAVELVATDDSWDDDTGLDTNQAYRARRKVEDVGWVSCQTIQLHGNTTTRITVDIDALEAALATLDDT